MGLRVFAVLLAAVFVLASAPDRAVAQSLSWIQVEAQPDIRTARQRARTYARNFPNVRAFRTPTGWYAITIGPVAADQAEARLQNLKDRARVPNDAFLVENRLLLSQIWPVDANAGASGLQVASAIGASGDASGGGLTITGQTDEATGASGQDQTQTEEAVEEVPEETPRQARALERRLSRDKKMEIQTALVWTGHYESAIDGAFGSGTRRAIKAYQVSMGYDDTGYLTTRQMDELTNGYQETLARIGFSPVIDNTAGIEVPMPTNLVEFSKFEAPFAHYDAKGDAKVRVLLISQEGSRQSLSGLYDIMETLEIVPLEGYRQKKRDWFVLSGHNETTVSYTYARLDDGLIKGFTLIWPPSEDDTMKRVATAMYDGFKPIPDVVLDPALGDPEEENIDLVSGLEIRKADRAASGFYVDRAGHVVTEASAVDNCTRITVDDDQPYSVAGRDDAQGIAVLAPENASEPIGWANFSDSGARLRSKIVVSGYSYYGMLGAPTQSFGAFQDNKGLNGEANLRRLSVQVQPGDAGGPVLAQDGAVVGMLLSRGDGTRQLPEDVQFAVAADALETSLVAAGVGVSMKTDASIMAPEDLSVLATDVTVLVSCWN